MRDKAPTSEPDQTSRSTGSNQTNICPINTHRQVRAILCINHFTECRSKYKEYNVLFGCREREGERERFFDNLRIVVRSHYSLYKTMTLVKTVLFSCFMTVYQLVPVKHPNLTLITKYNVKEKII